MSEDKENFTAGVTSTSPKTYKNVLKPISPNINNTTNHKKILEGGEFEDHFNLLHLTQEEIQTQLHDIQVQSKQTSVDLGQLVDRSKNNNQNLNRLLENVVSYSQEVMTEGNATKADMHSILERLDVNDSNNEKIRKLIEERLNISKDNIKDVIQETMSRDADEWKTYVKELETCLTKSSKEGFTSIENDLTKLVESIEEKYTRLESCISTNSNATSKDEQILKTVIDKVAESGAETKDSLHVLSTKQSEVASSLSSATRTINSTMEKIQINIDNIKEKLPPSDLVEQIILRVISELNSVSLDDKSVSILEDIRTKLEDIQSNYIHNDNDNDSTARILAMLSNIDEKRVNQNSELEQRERELEAKIQKLETKYSLLSNSYSTKYEEYKHLEVKYKELVSKIESASIPTVKDGSQMKHIRQFHLENIKEISKEDDGFSINHRKRIASVPTYSNRAQMSSIPEGEFTNNSEDEF
ncbi:uncharacterized protein J8A68_003996 [[Candida] subhashii]|uniref:Uncharacterized protein n=1 Tax=[Candida] subhashii TaxID=561895 RepID=A0A8J5UVT6_9ASCO|nr:uncharacterized protein J8A68_003996 [[Candida] subhashii]KAG7662465.1 hypothetical protein J8A68_003996 [[Candida] subhashii]